MHLETDDTERLLKIVFGIVSIGSRLKMFIFDSPNTPPVSMTGLTALKKNNDRDRIPKYNQKNKVGMLAM